MWFKNLKTYRFTKPFSINTAELNDMLLRMPFHTCGAQEIQSMGFISVLDGSDQLFHANDTAIVISLQIEQRLLPSSVINAELKTVIDKIQTDTGSPVSKKQQKELKEDITYKLLPRAFTKTKQIKAVILQEEQVIIVDAASDAQAETLLACLRKCVDSLPVVPILDTSRHALLTSWIMQECPEQIKILNEMDLISSADDGAAIKVKNHDLLADDVLSHIKSGHLVDRLAINFDNLFDGVISATFDIKRLKYDSELLDENQDIPKDQVSARLDADLALFVDILKKLSASLLTFSRENA